MAGGRKGVDNPTQQLTLLVRAAYGIQDYWLPASALGISVGLGLVAMLFTDDFAKLMKLSTEVAIRVKWWCLVAGGILLFSQVVIGIMQLLRERRLSFLEDELRDATATRELLISNAQAICDGFLQDLARGPLGFGTQAENSERITLYVHDSESQFQPIGRFSFNQSFIKKGRSGYRDVEGCIGKAWEHGWVFELLPDPKENLEKWVQACYDLKLPKSVSRAMNMKSCLLCGCSVHNSASRQPVAVIIIESTDPNRYTEDNMSSILTEDRRNYIARLVEMLRPWLGDAGDARKEGF